MYSGPACDTQAPSLAALTHAAGLAEDDSEPDGDGHLSHPGRASQAEADDPIGRAPGEYLWSDSTDGYDYAGFLKREHATQSPLNWSALFQQRPVPEAGDYFRLEWLKPYEQMPDIKTLRVYAASDFAVSTKESADWTVHLICGLDPQSRLYVLDLWRAQCGPDRSIEEMLTLQKKWAPIFWCGEKGVIAGSLEPFLLRRSRERKIPVFVKQFASKHDKQTRAQSIRGFMAQGGLFVPTKASWYSTFQDELLSFPVGKHDDCVDALSLIGRLLDTMLPGNAIKETITRFDPAKDAYRAVTDEETLNRVMWDNEYHLHQLDEAESWSWKTL